MVYTRDYLEQAIQSNSSCFYVVSFFPEIQSSLQNAQDYTPTDPVHMSVTENLNKEKKVS